MLLSVILSLGVAVAPALILHLIRIPAGTTGGYVAGTARLGGEPELLATPDPPAAAKLPARPEFPDTTKLPATQQLLAAPKLPATPKLAATPKLPPPASVVVTATTKLRPRPAPTTVAPTTTPTTTKSVEAERPRQSQTGQASWYGGTKGECAHRTIPLRTLVKVVNLASGRETHCTVTNRGPHLDGRIIDLTKGTFAELAPVGRGIIDVRIEW